MSSSGSAPPEVDLTKEDKSTTPKAKKMVQSRLPFAPINKNKEAATAGATATPSPNQAKRKRSESEEEKKEGKKVEKRAKSQTEAELRAEMKKKKEAKPSTNGLSASSKLVEEKKEAEKEKEGKDAEDEAMELSTPEDSKTKPGETASPKNKPLEKVKSATPVSSKPSTPTSSQSGSPKTPCSPQVLESRKVKIKVAIAKMSVALMELNDEMEKASDNSEFGKAAEIKAEHDAKTKEKEELQAVYDSNDAERIIKAEKELGGKTPKSKPSTPKSSKAASPKAASPKAPCSAQLLEAMKAKIEEAITKMGDDIKEMNTSMDKAAEEKEFLKAAELKTEIDSKTKEKEELQAALDSGDAKKMGKAVDDLDSNLKKKPETPKTPASRKRTAAKVATPGSGASPNLANKVKRLTPKQLEKQKQKEEREKERLEKEKEREKAKIEKEKQKEAEKVKREEEKKKKEEEKKKKEEEREKEKQEREQLKKQKEEEKEQMKKQKEEARIAEQQRKEEEKKKKEEEKRKAEEEENKKREKEKMAFKSFFNKTAVQKPKEPEEKKDATTNSNFVQFRVKKDMRLAPTTRAELTDSRKEALLSLLGSEEPKEKLYVALVKKEDYTKGSCERTWPPPERKEEEEDEVEVIEEEEDDVEMMEEGGVMVVEDEEGSAKKRVRAKLLQFSENQRPPYFGTFSKKSRFVGPRKPFGKDETLLEYEYDSDDDWEEEEQGESLSDEENDKEEDDIEKEDEEDDDGFFVGHGVLDKDEMHNEDSEEEEEAEEGGNGKGEVKKYDEDLEAKKQQMRAQEFEEEYKKKKPMKLKPRVFGCFFVGEKTEQIAYEQLQKILQPYSAVNLFSNGSDPIPTSLSAPESSSPKKGDGDDKPSTSATPKAKKVFPEEAVKDFIRLVHANQNGKHILATEFAAFWREQNKDKENPAEHEISKNKILNKLSDLADYKRYEEPGPMHNKKVYVVKREVIEKYELESALEVPNAWQYVTEVPKREPGKVSGETPEPAAAKGAGGDSAATPGKPKGDIQKFFTPKAEGGASPFGTPKSGASSAASTPSGTPKSAGGGPAKKERKRANIVTLFSKAKAAEETKAEKDEKAKPVEEKKEKKRATITTLFSKATAKADASKSAEKPSEGAKEEPKPGPSGVNSKPVEADKDKPAETAKEDDSKDKPAKKRVPLIKLD